MMEKKIVMDPNNYLKGIKNPSGELITPLIYNMIYGSLDDGVVLAYIYNTENVSVPQDYDTDAYSYYTIITGESLYLIDGEGRRVNICRYQEQNFSIQYKGYRYGTGTIEFDCSYLIEEYLMHRIREKTDHYCIYYDPKKNCVKIIKNYDEPYYLYFDDGIKAKKREKINNKNI